MAISSESQDIAVRRQVTLEGLKSGQIKTYEKFLKKIDKGIRLQLTKSEITSFGRDRLRKQLKSTREYLDDIYSEWEEEYAGELMELAQMEADFEAVALSKVAPDGFSFSVPAAGQLETAVRTQPLSVRGPNGGNLLKPFIKDFSSTQKNQIVGAIRQGYYEGRTNAQILRTIRGTKANKFKDGVLGVSKNHASAIIRTSTQHAASVARFKTWEANDDIIVGYKWVSTLDSRTTQVCRSLDGQIFKIGEGPLPPIHIGCRSTTVAEFSDDLAFLQDGRTRATFQGRAANDENYYTWLKRQPAEFQDKAIGQTRGKLLRNGGLTSDEFARLNLGRNFRPLTLEQMRASAPDAFKKANIAA